MLGCKTCEGVQNPEDYKQYCYECIEGYSFNLTDEENRYGNCFISTFEFDGYFENNGYYEKCDDNCQKCSKRKTNCTECKTNYYKRLNGDDYCYEKQTDEYLTEDNKLDKCYDNCETCSKKGNELKNNCDKCKSDFHFYKNEQNIINCVQKPPSDNYYLELGNDTFCKCYERCDLCDFQGNETYHNCKRCHINYYKIPNNEINCYTEEEIDKFEIYKNYYPNDTERKIKKCHESCATCEEGGNDEETKCKTCADGYVFIKLPNNIINCVIEETLLDIYPNYYKTKDKNDYDIYYQCQEYCATCIRGGNEIMNNCSSCIEGYKKLGLINCIKEGEEIKNTAIIDG